MTSQPLLFAPTRGEIATRILATSRELGLRTLTVHHSPDTSHTFSAHSSVPLPSSSSFTDAALIHNLALQHHATFLHPGYGFLSESAELAKLCEASGITFVGPSSAVLEITGSKTRSRELAESCNVPVLPAARVETAAEAAKAAETFGFPVMLKAISGGGGRGIRLVNTPEEVDSAWKRATGEAPDGKVFIEKAARGTARHVEVQILGDGNGGIAVLGTRDCSIQRRFQKVVEIAPSGLPADIENTIAGYAQRLGEKLVYRSLGTVEFLVDVATGDAWFLEINPRIQVEHTITETILGTDLIELQLGLFLSPGTTLPKIPSIDEARGFAVQLRLTTTSTGTITTFIPPSGNGIRIDTHLKPGTQVTSHFDPLLAKIIVHASTWDMLIRKCKRALEDTVVVGVSTDLQLLRSIVSHPAFAKRETGIRWLEETDLSTPPPMAELYRPENIDLTAAPAATANSSGSGSAGGGAVSLGPPLLKKTDTWAVTLTPPASSSAPAQPSPSTITITKLISNDFPLSLRAEILHSTPAATTPYHLDIKKSTSGAAASKAHRKGDPTNPSHVVVPFSGEVVEVGENVRPGGMVKKGEVLVVVKQMKTELEVRSSREGKVSWAWEGKVGEMVDGGELVVAFEEKGSKL